MTAQQRCGPVLPGFGHLLEFDQKAQVSFEFRSSRQRC